MRHKMVVAAVAGLALIAAQSAMAANSATVRVGDRLGARAAASQELVGIPLFAMVIGGAAFVGLVATVADDDDGDSN